MAAARPAARRTSGTIVTPPATSIGIGQIGPPPLVGEVSAVGRNVRPRLPARRPGASASRRAAAASPPDVEGFLVHGARR